MTIPHSMNADEYISFVARMEFAVTSGMTYEHWLEGGASMKYSITDVCSMINRGQFRRVTFTISEVAGAARQRIRSGAIDQDVVDRANVLDPGFAGQIPVAGKADEANDILLDGGHRCVRAYQEGVTFDVYELDVLRTTCCMIPPNYERAARLAMDTIMELGDEAIELYGKKLGHAMGIEV